MKLYEYYKDQMTFKNVTLQIAIFLGVVTLLSSIITYSIGFSKGINKEIESIPLEEKIEIIKQQDTFSVEKLETYLEELNLKYPDIVMAQAIIETGNFKSRIFKENNNLFGMKVAKIRPTTNDGEQHEHAYYNTWRESVLDYALYQSRYLCSLSKDEYIQYLSNYAEDSSYTYKVKKLINQTN